jgi:hypothetical protein
VYQQLLIRLQNNEDLHCSGTASATGTINDNDAAPTSTITPASATEGSPAVFEFSLSNPSAVDTTLPYTPMELLEVLITLLRKRYRNRTCGCYYGNRKYQQLLMIDENNEDFTLLWNGFGYWNNQ